MGIGWWEKSHNGLRGLGVSGICISIRYHYASIFKNGERKMYMKRPPVENVPSLVGLVGTKKGDFLTWPIVRCKGLFLNQAYCPVLMLVCLELVFIIT